MSNLIRAIVIRLYVLVHRREPESEVPLLSETCVLSNILTKKIRNYTALIKCTTITDSKEDSYVSLTVSCLLHCDVYVLQNVQLSLFHSAILGDLASLTHFVNSSATETRSISPGTNILRFRLPVIDFPLGVKRDCYPLIIGLVPNVDDDELEKIMISFHIIHVKSNQFEKIDTGIMYTFWKTNWNRLLTPQVLYAATDNSTLFPRTSSQQTTLVKGEDPMKWKPSCFICLSELFEQASKLYVLLPCRHAAICSDCFQSLYNSSFLQSPPRLRLGFVTCPLCRTAVNSLLSLPT